MPSELRGPPHNFRPLRLRANPPWGELSYSEDKSWPNQYVTPARRASTRARPKVPKSPEIFEVVIVPIIHDKSTVFAGYQDKPKSISPAFPGGRSSINSGLRVYR